MELLSKNRENALFDWHFWHALSLWNNIKFHRITPKIGFILLILILFKLFIYWYCAKLIITLLVPLGVPQPTVAISMTKRLSSLWTRRRPPWRSSGPAPRPPTHSRVDPPPRLRRHPTSSTCSGSPPMGRPQPPPLGAPRVMTCFNYLETHLQICWMVSFWNSDSAQIEFNYQCLIFSCWRSSNLCPHVPGHDSAG